MKAMISQPMAGKTDEEIVETRDRAVGALLENGYEVVNTLFTDEWYSNDAMAARGVVQIPLCFLAKSLENMSLCHAVLFCKGWQSARGCKIEHAAAIAYGLKILYEDERDTNEKNRPTHEELKQAAQPLLDLLYQYYHPHAVITVTQSHVEVLEGDMCAPLPLRD